jgi:phospho-N-acetylmuramoyl-pentapeptide-transferase
MSFVVSFILTVILGKFFIPLLTRLKYKQTILEIGPAWHTKKQGTPTMGGIFFIFGIIFSIIVCLSFYYNSDLITGIPVKETRILFIKIFAGIIMAFLYGMVGFADDYIKVTRGKNLGLTAKQKLVMQFMIAAMFLGTIYTSEVFYCGSARTFVSIPFFGNLDFGLFYWIFSAFVIVGIVNATNLTDGVDGLCSTVSLAIGFLFIIISKIFMMNGLSIVSAAMAGGNLGFLIWNFHPAKVFMGDTGSLFLGGLVCALGFAVNNITILIIIAMIYILEMFSVMIQVLYFKITKGKRLFKMSPVHHHFEMIGYPEKKICYFFGLFALICGFIAIALIIFRKI